MRFVFATCSIAIVLAWLFLAFSHSSDLQTIKFQEKSGFSSPLISDTDDNLLWFLHVSDIHLTKFKQFFERNKNFREFVRMVPNILNPDFIIASGDLTDAKDKTKVFSEQYQEEWEQYHSILNQHGLLKKDFFYDIRGNHDCFNVPSLSSSSNYFSKYSSSQKPSYWFTKTTPFGKYSFIAIDACPEPGASRPFNFFGHLTQKDMNELSNAVEQISKEGHNHTIVFGHYPILTMSSELSSKGESFSQLSQSFSAYLCGHLHTLFGFVHRMYARHAEGFLELEVGDLAFSRFFRLFVIDHDLISFSDVRLNEFPFIVITNPKDASTLLPTKEPINKISTSSHIRMMIVSQYEIESIQIEIDGKEHNEPVRKATKVSSKENIPLYVSSWDPSKYATGLHSIKVSVLDKDGNYNEKTQLFSVDGTVAPMYSRGSFLLNLNAQLILTFLILSFDIFTVAALLLPKLWLLMEQMMTKKPENFLKEAHLRRLFLLKDAINQPQISIFSKLRYQIHFHFLSYFLRFIYLSEQTGTFFILVFYGIYVLIGPWFAGRFIKGQEGVYGLFYLFGMDLGGERVGLLETQFYGIFDIILLYFPLVLLLAHKAPLVRSHSNSSHPISLLISKHPVIILRVLVLIGLFNQFKTSRDLSIYYDSIALLFSPAKFWWALIATYLAYKSL